MTCSTRPLLLNSRKLSVCLCDWRARGKHVRGPDTTHLLHSLQHDLAGHYDRLWGSLHCSVGVLFETREAFVNSYVCHFLDFILFVYSTFRSLKSYYACLCFN
jgi:hypothetical protein